jgi:hypothetical protein
MSISTVHVRTLEKAARILGGEAGLATYLQVSREELAAWMEAKNTLPSWAFITVVELISSGPAAAGAAANPAVEADHADR